MAWYVRYGLGKAPPHGSDPPRKQRGWVTVMPLSRTAAIKLGCDKTAGGMSAEAGEVVEGKPLARFFPGSFKDMAAGRKPRWPKAGRLKPKTTRSKGQSARSASAGAESRRHEKARAPTRGMRPPE